MTDRISGLGSAVASSMMQMWQDYLFKKVDSNSDGSIDKSEMEAVSQTEQNGTSIDQIFTSLDSNQDSLISMQEAEAGLSKMGQDMKKEGFPMGMGMKGRAGQNGSENMFDSLDADSDGYAGMEELTAVFGNDASKIMNLVDTDGDGQISRAESDAHEAEKKAQGNTMNQGMSANNSQMFTDFFNSIDTNQDGNISQDELKTAMGDNASNVSNLFSQIDSNEDGSIDSSEFETAMQASMPPPPPPPPPGGMTGTGNSASSSESEQTTETVFNTIDTNGDGYISPEELAAYLEQQENGSSTSGNLYSQLSDSRNSLISTLLGSTIDTRS
jgi:Ca2+-binding EF-hand superfamily protein